MRNAKGQFVKGNVSWCKGTKGIKKANSGSFKKGRIPHNKGKHHSEETKGKISKSRKGRFTCENSNNYKDGRCKNKKYISWLKNKRNRKKRDAEGSHTFEEWENLKAQYNYTCLCCKKKEPEIKLTEDHIIPLSKNGTDYIDNIQPLCMHCNLVKHTKTINYLIIQNYKTI